VSGIGRAPTAVWTRSPSASARRFELIAQGRTNAAIARELVITVGAVEKHISSIFSKLDLPASDDDHRRVLAVLTYLRAAEGA
jgi:DNA-binding NarL/FixJ family response regulator